MSNEYASRLASFLPSEQDLTAFALQSSTERLLSAFTRLTTWFSVLSTLRDNQEQSILLQSAHSKIIEIWILAPLGLLHSSYAALRTVVDISTSYTYYCSHPVEWEAVCEDRASWVGRGAIIDWHLTYSPHFDRLQKNFGLKEKLYNDYQQLSAYIHGIPIDGLPTLTGINRTEISQESLGFFIELAERVDSNINLLFIGANHQELASAPLAGCGKTISRVS